MKTSISIKIWHLHFKAVPLRKLHFRVTHNDMMVYMIVVSENTFGGKHAPSR